MRIPTDKTVTICVIALALAASARAQVVGGDSGGISLNDDWRFQSHYSGLSGAGDTWYNSLNSEDEIDEVIAYGRQIEGAGLPTMLWGQAGVDDFLTSVFNEDMAVTVDGDGNTESGEQQCTDAALSYHAACIDDVAESTGLCNTLAGVAGLSVGLFAGSAAPWIGAAGGTLIAELLGDFCSAKDRTRRQQCLTRAQSSSWRAEHLNACG